MNFHEEEEDLKCWTKLITLDYLSGIELDDRLS